MNNQTPLYRHPLNTDSLVCPWGDKALTFSLNLTGSLQCRRFLWARRTGYYFYSPQSSTVIKMAATTTLRTRTRFRPPKIRLHCRLFNRLNMDTFYGPFRVSKSPFRRGLICTCTKILFSSNLKNTANPNSNFTPFDYFFLTRLFHL